MSFLQYFRLDEEEQLKKGAFHKWAIKQGFIDSMDDEIPMKAVEAGLKSNDGHVRKMAQFAKNMMK